jgi:hypothetical protein
VFSFQDKTRANPDSVQMWRLILRTSSLRFTTPATSRHLADVVGSPPMESILVSLIAVSMFAIYGTAFFAIIYCAVRLAIRHERRKSD